MRARPLWWTLVITACLGDPVGPSGRLVVNLENLPSDTILVGAPGESVPRRLEFRAVDGQGRGIAGASVDWIVSGTAAHVSDAAGTTDAAGRFSAQWILGTRASEPQGLTATVSTEGHKASVVLQAKAVPNRVSALDLGGDSILVKLGDRATVTATAIDPYGNRFPPPTVVFTANDTVVASVDTLGGIHTRKRGYSRVAVASQGVTDTTVVHVIQIVDSILLTPDTVRFSALGQVRSVRVDIRDDRGILVADSTPFLTVGDSQVAVPVTPAPEGGNALIQSAGNGTTTVRAILGGVTANELVDVRQEPAVASVTPDSMTFDALGDTARASVTVQDSLGRLIVVPMLAFTTSDTAVVTATPDGRINSRGNGSAWLRVAAGVARDSIPIRVAQVVARVQVPRDSLQFTSLHAVLPSGAEALDRLGVNVVGALVAYASSDSAIARVTSAGSIEAIRNGTALVTAQADGKSASILVLVAQRPVRVLAPADSIRFVALGETQSVVGIAVDSLGNAVSTRVDSLRVSDTGVVTVLDSQTVRARKNGVSAARFSVAGLPAQVGIIVQQVPDTVVLGLPKAGTLVNPAAAQVFSIGCTVLDRNGYTIAMSPVVASTSQIVAGATCDTLTANRSGFDTLIVSVGGKRTVAGISVAVRPTANTAAGQYITVDSTPSGAAPWAPTARKAPDGSVELDFTAYYRNDSLQVSRGDLHRLVSSDGLSFKYDGVVLPYDSTACSLNGQGIENVVVVQRNDGPGWRMYYSSGGVKCYGWQVYSATSTDGRNWTKEPGVRLSNGGTVPPAPSTTPPWPVGEGMWVEQLPTGNYRMIVGSFQHLQPPPIAIWQIAEWQSSDQLNWSYTGTVLTTSAMPLEGQGSVYGPAIVEYTPGIYRMVFTADNRNTGPFHSQLWSAVSTDREHWQIEGVILGASGTNLYYPSLVGGQLFFLRQDSGAPLGLASARLTMP